MINIAIIGFGIVGSAAYEVAVQNAGLIEKRVGDSVKVKKIVDILDFENHPAPELLTKNFDDVMNDPTISIVIETIGGVRHAYEFTKKALMGGKSVVTSNKELVAMHGVELTEIAKKNNISYLFEASVGGGIPIIRPLKQCLAANEITEIYGILNGTSNYILTMMREEGKPFAEALKEAQAKGYAENNPTADIEGHDAGRKISILSWVAFGQTVDSEKIDRTGISNITSDDMEKAKAAGCVIKLIGRAKLINGKAHCTVAPELIPLSDPLAIVDGVYNAIVVRGNFIGDAMFYGHGAGGRATSSAVMGDVIEIARGIVASRKRA
ncbi:MAG: homoserine dehydrogenase [Methanomassiliicoccaceae archaeon]|nr:homoserine dehydrogenase [Methanomassiliicoccaceae archaeon]